jgi:hypothetical protein
MDFKKAITHCLNNPSSPDSCVLETISGRGTLHEIINHAEMLRRLDALIEENDWNYHILTEVMSTIEKNKKNPKDKGVVTSRFRSAAIELLLTDRYLNEDASFYNIVSTCLVSVHALNDQLRSLNYKAGPEGTETWFEKYGKMYFERFDKNREVLDATKKRLSERVFHAVF